MCQYVTMKENFPEYQTPFLFLNAWLGLKVLNLKTLNKVKNKKTLFTGAAVTTSRDLYIVTFSEFQNKCVVFYLKKIYLHIIVLYEIKTIIA